MVAFTTPLNFPYPTAGDSLKDVVSTIPQQAAERMNDALAAISGVSPAGPVAVGYQPSFVASVTGTNVFRRAGMATLQVGFTYTGVGNWGSGGWVGTVPAGYRPPGTIYFPVVSNDWTSTRWMELGSNGVLLIRTVGSGVTIGAITYAI